MVEFGSGGIVSCVYFEQVVLFGMFTFSRLYIMTCIQSVDSRCSICLTVSDKPTMIS